MGIEGPGLPKDVSPEFLQQAQEQQKSLDIVAQRSFADLADRFHLPPSFTAKLEQDTRISKKIFIQVQGILKRRAALTERGSADLPLEQPDCTLRIRDDGRVEMHVGGTVYDFTNQTVKKEWEESLEKFIRAIKAEGFTNVTREEAEELFAYILENGKKHCEEAKTKPNGVVYIRAGKGFSRGLQFNKDGSIFIHFNKKSKKDPRVGEGTFKKVRFAFDVGSGKRIVVATCKDRVEEETLKREIAFQQRFQGKVGIAQVMQLIQVDGKYEGKHFFIQPHYNQGDLWDRMAQRLRLTRREQLSITKDLLQGAAALEEAGIIHRDIKSSNIFLHRDRSGQMHAYIADFGTAVEVEEQQYRVAGTPEYLPPENRTRSRAQTMAGDMWAIGYSIRDMYMEKYLAKNELPKPRGTMDKDPIAHLCQGLLNPDEEKRLTAKQALAIYGPHIDKLLA